MAKKPLCVPQQRRPTTSSERGRAFRERERQRIAHLEQSIVELEREVAEKTFLRGIWHAKYLRARHTAFGSLTRLVQEYYSVVRFGVREFHERAAPIEFLSRITHPDARLGDVVGPEGMISQWKLYTKAHGRYETHVRAIDVGGPEEDPIVFAQLDVATIFTRTTVEMLFPHVRDDEGLIQRLMGRHVAYRGATQLRFSRGDQIVMQYVQFDFVEGLLDAGISLYDVERLLQTSRISSSSTIHVMTDSEAERP